MDGRGGCCIARYATGAHDMSKVDRIMLRFRPIAPKPVAGSATAGGPSESSDACSRGGRAKRKYVRDNNNSAKRCNKRRKSSPEQKDAVVTLPLLPETPDPKDSSARDLTLSVAEEVRNSVNVPLWLSFENSASGKKDPSPPYWYCATSSDQPVVTTPPLRLVGSCVTVECVTDTWVDGDGLGSTDQERRVNLSKDTCPGFISDSLGRVTWTNGSYRKMVSQESEDGEKVRVWLVTKEEKLRMTMRAVLPYLSFTCTVRVQYTCGKERSSLTVPCDVWRMDSGGYAWRLDVKAALSLSLGR